VVHLIDVFIKYIMKPLNYSLLFIGHPDINSKMFMISSVKIHKLFKGVTWDFLDVEDIDLSSYQGTFHSWNSIYRYRYRK